MIQKQKKKYQISQTKYRQATKKTKKVKNTMKIKKISALNMNQKRTKLTTEMKIVTMDKKNCRRRKKQKLKSKL